MVAPATSQAARPAQFDRAAQHRRAMIAKINIARHQLGMIEDDYRQLLFDTTGRTSLKECDTGRLDKMVTALKSKGFRPLPGKHANEAASPGRGRSAAMHPMARKARALWISLHHLGVVKNPAEEALEAFARKQLGCERLTWAKQSDGYKLIEALKNMAERNGWRQTGDDGQALTVLQLQQGLCDAIMAKLKAIGEIPEQWLPSEAMWRLCGETLSGDGGIYPVEMYTHIAATLGAALRKAEGGQ